VEDGARESLTGIFFCRTSCWGPDSAGNAQQLAAEVFFQAGGNDLLAVAHRKRIEVPGHRVGAGFAYLLVDAAI
jgi:hypothetical protein